MTVAQRFDPRHNSLNFLRLAFASAVIVSHAKPLGGFGHDPAIARQTVGTWAVMGFFAISGYLIAASRMHTQLPEFFARRVLRIYPGFVACLLVTAVVFAPLSVIVGSGSYSPMHALSYVVHNLGLKVEADGIAGTLSGVPYGSAWNGSLWTLFYEFACYVAIGLLLTLPARWRHRAVLGAFLVSAIAGGYGAHHPLPTTADHFFSLAPVFFAGSLLYLFGERVRFDWRLGCLAIALLPFTTELQAMQYLGAPLMAYACLWLGVVLPLHKIGSRNDISYGVYIYAFPVQRILVLLHVNQHGVVIYAIVSMLATLPFAVASWLLVERRALALKRKLRHPSIPPQTRLGPGHAVVITPSQGPAS